MKDGRSEDDRHDVRVQRQNEPDPAGSSETTGSKPKVARTRPWQAARPGAAMRLGAVDELLTVVTFDVSCDRARKRAGDMCKDYDLHRTQWSVFEGLMTRNRREELWDRLVCELNDAEGGGRLAMYPIGAREAVWAQREVVKGMKAVSVAVGGSEHPPKERMENDDG